MTLTEKRQNFYSHSDEFFHKFYEIFSKNNFVTLYLGKINLDELNKNLEEKKKILENELKSIENIDSKKANSRKIELKKELDSINNNLKLSIKNHGTLTVSSYLTVNYGNKSWALYAANDMDYKSLFANYLVYEKQIIDAKNKNLKIFDVFGTIGDPNSSSSLSGLHDFKKKWGGEYTEFVGEFDYILNPIMCLLYKTITPIRHKISKKRLRKKVKKDN